MDSMYVAVIGRYNAEKITMSRPSTFTGADREAVIQAAIQERATWGKKAVSEFHIFIGELTGEVCPVHIPYTVVPLGVPRGGR